MTKREYPLLKHPCSDCPFRSDKPFYLEEQRKREIVKDLEFGLSFLCHKTINYGEDSGWNEEWDRYDASGEEKHCAGAMIILQKQGIPNTLMQVGSRLQLIDLNELDLESPVFGTLEEFVRSNNE